MSTFYGEYPPSGSGGSGGGITSINGDATAAQTIAAGSGISVVSASGTTTITNTGGSGSGITQLTGDVTAGPGSGSVAASVVRVNGASVPVSKTIVGTNSSGQIVDASSASLSNNTSGSSGSCTGNSATATTAVSFSGSLSGDVTGGQASTSVASVGGSSATAVHLATLAANAATSLNIAYKIVSRDANGDFAARNITATTFTGALTGNAATATTLSNKFNIGVQYSPTITSADVTGWTTVRSVAVVYQTQDGAWRMKFNVTGIFDPGLLTGISIGFPDTTVFKSTPFFVQACSGLRSTGTYPVITPGAASAFASPGVQYVSVIWPQILATGVSASGDVELDSKPSWAT